MTKEEAIEYLFNTISFCKSIDINWAEAVSVEVLEIAVNALKKQEPQKTGQWIRDGFGTKCCACGLYAYRDTFDRPWESPFCPICGAKMDGKENK